MQRVAIGRALVRQPAIYLMDEPLSSLDAKLRAELRVELKRIQMELGATVLYVTHDQIEAMTMASAHRRHQRGRLLQLGTPREIYESPTDVYVAARLGTPSDQSLAGRAGAGGADAASAPTRSASAPSICRSPSPMAARSGGVHRVEHLGDQNHVHLDFRGQPRSPSPIRISRSPRAKRSD